MMPLALTILTAALRAPLPMTPKTVPQQLPAPAAIEAAAPEKKAAEKVKAEEAVWLDMSYDTVERYGSPRLVTAKRLRLKKRRGLAVAMPRCGGCGDASARPSPADRILIVP